MTTEKLEKALGLKGTISSIESLLKIFSYDHIDCLIDLRTSDMKCSYTRVQKSEIPKSLLDEIVNVTSKYYCKYQKEFEEL